MRVRASNRRAAIPTLPPPTTWTPEPSTTWTPTAQLADHGRKTAGIRLAQRVDMARLCLAASAALLELRDVRRVHHGASVTTRSIHARALAHHLVRVAAAAIALVAYPALAPV